MRPATLLLLLSLIAPAPPPLPAPSQTIDRVEEDWELVIARPDLPAAGPQITTTMRPAGLTSSPVINFNLNYRDRPQFQAGGLQIQGWNESNLLGLATEGHAPLATVNETITWTQRMTLSGGSLEYEVRSGHSTTWGDFGGDDLKVSFPSTASNLGEYDPTISAQKSGIGWQSDHVTSMKLVRVRYYSNGNLVSTDDAARVVHSLDSQ